MNSLVQSLESALGEIPLIDPHTHIDPHQPGSRSLEDILGYHYYTELAHSAGMPTDALDPRHPARDRCRFVIERMAAFDNTVQYSWFEQIAREFLGWQGERIRAGDANALYELAERRFQAAGWPEECFRQTNLERLFLTNEFDDPLEGFDTHRFVPCLRVDALVFRFREPAIRERLERATGIDAGDLPALRRAIRKLFELFKSRGARACAISLPPDFIPESNSIFMAFAEGCREFGLPFDLMIGVNRDVYERGVHQGRDLFDQRTSLLQYRKLFNDFPEVAFPISVLCGNQNRELAAYAWIFPNVICLGHWWYSNIPAAIERDLRERLECVPQTKLVGYYSDAYKLEFIKPKYAMYRRALARVLATEFVEPGRMTEQAALDLGKRLLRGNVEEIYRL